MMFSDTPIVVPDDLAVGGVDEDPASRRRFPGRCRERDPVVDEMNAGEHRIGPSRWPDAEPSRGH